MQFLIDIGLSLVYFCIVLLLCAWVWRFWMMYIHQKHLGSLSWVMLEIKLPREINKSPLATEVALASLLQGGGLSDWYSKYFKGNLPAFASLEIASLEGVIHFYIRIQKKFRPLVEANFYAQYPGIEIIEADDYTSKIRYHHLSKDTSVWGMNYKLGRPWTPTDQKTGKDYMDDKKKPVTMSADFLPIKTYVDYGLDKDPKEEFKTDPLTLLLEMMGSIGKGEYMWYQILVQDEGVYSGSKMPKFYVDPDHKHISLKDMADARKKQIRTSGFIKRGDIVYDEYGYPKQKKSGKKDDNDNDILENQTYTFADAKVDIKAVGKKEMELTQDEKDELEGITKKISKPLALVVMRILYVTKKENFNPAHINDTLSFAKPFNGVNFLVPSNPTNPYSFPWENLGEKRSAWRAEEKFEAYAEREGFFPHIGERKSLDSSEDFFFWGSTMKTRKIFRMFYEAIFYPFDHPHADEAFVLNMEELATLWHLPGAVAGTPTLPRIDSTKGIAPVNLPI